MLFSLNMVGKDRQSFLIPLTTGLLLLPLLAWSGTTATVRSLSEGAPREMSRSLDPIVYTEIKTRRLAHARVVWVNFDLLAELGIPIPRQGLTPEFEQEILDAFAYAMPGPDDPPDAFLRKVKKFFADRYGGLGMNGNLGSGRSAAAGSIQIQGVGGTPTVGPH